LIDDTNTIVNVNKSSLLSGSSTDNNNSELSGNFSAKHNNNNESTIDSFTNVSVNDNYNNFICPPVPSATTNVPSRFIKKESHDD
jgi:hypothetical protein